MNCKRLEGKVAIVTGGARDLGRAVSVKLALEGAKVCLNYFDNEADAMVTLDMIKKDGGTAIAVQGDMTKAADVKNLFAKTAEAFGGKAGPVRIGFANQYSTSPIRRSTKNPGQFLSKIDKKSSFFHWICWDARRFFEKAIAFF